MDYPKSDPTVGLINGKFFDGDVVGGVKASRDPAAWANAVTDELLAILTGLGVTPDEANNGQVIDALLAFFAPIPGSAAQVFRVATAVGANDATPLAQVQAMIGAYQIKTVSITRDMSAAAGSVSYTGVGFPPDEIEFIYGVDGQIYHGIGHYDPTLQSHSSVYAGGLSITNINLAIRQDTTSAAVHVYGDVTPTADGFDIAWTKEGLPTGTLKIIAICKRNS